jgi:hypothetical protein
MAHMAQKINTLTEYKKVLSSFLERCGVDLKINHIGKNLFAVKPKNTPKDLLRDLPEGYAYFGGAARSVLLHELGYDISPRDLDVVRVSEDSNMDDEVSSEFMEDDYNHGYGVKEIESDYFSSRDFSINEIIYHKGYIYLTKQCLLDSVRGIIRFTDYEKGVKGNNYHNNGETLVNNKLLAKALRLSAELTLRGVDNEIAGNEFDFQHIQNFHIALHLDRALERSCAVAQQYVEELIKHDQISEKFSNVTDLQNYLKNDTGFFFRFDAKSKIAEESQYVFGDDGSKEYRESIYGQVDMDKYDSLPWKESFSRTKK